jgi:hypothetical protein
MLAVDFYVFDLTAGDSEVGEAKKQIESLEQIYRMAWSARADGLLTAVRAVGEGPCGTVVAQSGPVSS